MPLPCYEATVRVLLILAILAVASPASADRLAPTGFTASVGAGLNLDTPFVEAQLGRRFTRAPHFEVFLDYSYGAAISEFAFQTFGVGARTYFARCRCGKLEVFHQAVMAFGLSASGNGAVEGRQLGERILGAFVTQGLGTQLALTDRWHLALVVSTGYPVWLRTELAARFVW